MNKFNALCSAKIAAAAALIALSSCSGGDNANQQMMMQQAAPQIATITLDYTNSDLSSTYPATIKGKTDVEIRPQVTGFITNVLVDEGQHVVKGQPLFKLDNVQFQAAVDNALAAVNVARTAVETAKLTAHNKKMLFEKNIISEYENQLAQNDLAMAQSQLAQAQSQLVNTQKNLSYTVVTAPSSGVIGTIPNREGTLASPSMAQALTTVSDNGDVYAYISLTEKDMLQLTENGKYTLNEKIKKMPEVTLRLSDGSIYPEPGKVSTVSGIIDNNTGSASVRVLFKNPNGLLRSGSTGQILMPVRLDSVIVIPQKATTELQDIRYAYVVNDSNVVTSVPITISPINDGKNFVVTSGLKPGQRIAVEGVGTKVRNGSVIQPVDPAQAAAAQQQAAQQQAAAGK